MSVKDSEPEAFILCWKDRAAWLVERSGGAQQEKKRLAGDRLSKKSEPDKTLTFILKDVWGNLSGIFEKTFSSFRRKTNETGRNKNKE